MGCINFNSNEEEEDEIEDNTPGLTQVYFDESLAKPKINSKTLVSNFKIKFTLTKGCKGVTSLFQLPMGNTVTNSGHGSVNIWSTKFDSIIDTKKLHGQAINDMLLIDKRIFLSISSEDQAMKGFFITNKFEKIFDTELDYKPIKLHGVNLLGEKKKFACAYKDGIIIYNCWDKISKREDEIAMDEYDKYLHKEEDPLIHTLYIEEIMDLYIPNGEIYFSVFMNGIYFAFNSLYLIKIWKYKKEEKMVKKVKENTGVSLPLLNNKVIQERAKMQSDYEQEQIKNGRKLEKKSKENQNQQETESTNNNNNNNDNNNNKIKRKVIPEQISNLITLKGHPKPITSLCSLRDGNLASGAKDKKIFIWSPKEEKKILTLDGHLGYVSALYQMNEGNLVSGDEFCNIIIWSKNYKYKVASVYQDGIILRFFQLISGELLSMSSKNQIKIWTFKRTFGKEKEVEDNFGKIKIKENKDNKENKKKMSKKQKKKEKEMEKRYKLEDDAFDAINKFIDDVQKEQENNQSEKEEESEDKNNKKNKDKDKDRNKKIKMEESESSSY